MNKSLSFEFSTLDTVLSVLAIAGIAVTGVVCIVVSGAQAVFA